jgi:hypothetical protein
MGSKYSWGLVFPSVLFTPPGCSYCVDSCGYEADISVCDAWLKKYEDDTVGRNLILTRNKKADKIIEDMNHDGLIHLVAENHEDFIRANKNVFHQKLIINGIKNSNLKKYLLYQNMDFIPVRPRIIIVFIKFLDFISSCYLYFQGTEHINNTILFFFKCLKYITIKWLKIKKY